LIVVQSWSRVNLPQTFFKIPQISAPSFKKFLKPIISFMSDSELHTNKGLREMVIELIPKPSRGHCGSAWVLLFLFSLYFSLAFPTSFLSNGTQYEKESNCCSLCSSSFC